MAISFTSIKLFSVPLLDGLSHVLTRNRREYATIRRRATYVSGKKASESTEDKGAITENMWFPDPITGDYKPVNTKEVDVDVSELRVSKKFNR
ncbi:unnamed protein product [Lupinus luteus]|uniref:Late embryogenesis abundant protein n=1 Tax=Lupinus luteus TaxID=3873 RepID=A0AAV1X6F3_LUPLU